jgi:hypothetical protein
MLAKSALCSQEWILDRQTTTCNGYACICELGFHCIVCNNKYRDRRKEAWKRMREAYEDGYEDEYDDIYGNNDRYQHPCDWGHTLQRTAHFEQLSANCRCRTIPSHIWQEKRRVADMIGVRVVETTRRRCNGYANTCPCAAMYRYGLCQCCWHKDPANPRIYFPYNASSVRKQFPVQKRANIAFISEWHHEALHMVSTVVTLREMVDIIGGYLESFEPPKKKGNVWLIDPVTRYASTQNGYYACNLH